MVHGGAVTIVTRDAMPDDAAIEQRNCCSALTELQDDLNWADVKKQWEYRAAQWQRSVNKIAGQGAPLS